LEMSASTRVARVLSSRPFSYLCSSLTPFSFLSIVFPAFAFSLLEKRVGVLFWVQRRAPLGHAEACFPTVSFDNLFFHYALPLWSRGNILSRPSLSYPRRFFLSFLFFPVVLLQLTPLFCSPFSIIRRLPHSPPPPLAGRPQNPPPLPTSLPPFSSFRYHVRSH